MSKIINIKILILEDDLETVEKIYALLSDIEKEKDVSFGVTVIPDYVQVEEFVNNKPLIKYDILLLDRDCFLGGSFHAVNLDNFDKDKVISISSVPEYNQQAGEKGVRRSVWKDYSNLDEFSNKLKAEIIDLI